MLDKSTLSAPLPADPTINPQEVARFDALAEQWWDPNGKYKTALLFNQARMSLILPAIARHFNLPVDAGLGGLKILDVGSGGGLICEPLASAGGQVLGIDASATSIAVARRHAAQNELSIEYRHCLASDASLQNEQFDVVINAEVVEHVPDQAALIRDCCRLVRPGGMLILATLNRTVKSWLVAIVGAEYLMRYLPIGTHDWKMFVKPTELSAMAKQSGLDLLDQYGLRYSPITGKWSAGSSLAVNYIQTYTKS